MVADRRVIARAGILFTILMRIVKMQFAASKWTRLAMKEIDEGKVSGGNCFVRIIAVRAEKIAIVAGGDLSLGTSDGEFLHPELIENF